MYSIMKRDIQNREDIELIIDKFYKKVLKDPVIAVYFTEVIPVDWEKHTPLMVNFWENILFFTEKYEGNPMSVHKRLNANHQMSIKDFQRWNNLFLETVNELFKGERAEMMKEKAMNISAIMQSSIFKS